MEDLQAWERSAIDQIGEAADLDSLQRLKTEFLGKKGTVSQALRSLGKLPPEARRDAGQVINACRDRVSSALDESMRALSQQALIGQLKKDWVDVTLPGRRLPRGSTHPLRMIEEEVVGILSKLGFSVATGPEVEHDWYNFEALNMPEDHPARDMQDTFFVAPNVVLRTHTSNVQIRTMTKREPPVRILAPGMVFRRDEVDPTHSPVFHQIEGLWIDDKATFADLKGALQFLTNELFGADAKLRFRPSFFPFTEPSAEVDVSCMACGGEGYTKSGDTCRLCKTTGWIEILGCGVVDPAVLESVGYDPQKWQGFAFGMGIERIAMLRWGVDDIRLFYENDGRFLAQFSGRA